MLDRNEKSLRNYKRCQRLCFGGVVILLAAFGLQGCKNLSQPGSASFASVIIRNHSHQEIQQAAAQVFGESGYSGRVTGVDQMLFQKEGTRANNIAYNGLVGTHYGAQTLVRVKTSILDIGGGSLRLQAQAFIVRNAGDSFFEEETRLTNARSRPYQKLLDKVAEKFN
jgi:hypothetical protein